MWAIVPVKDLREAKQRLAGLLTVDQRGALGLAMLADVLAASTAAHGLDGVVLVSPDADAQAVGREFGARIVAEPQAGGLNHAVKRAANVLAQEGAASILVLHGDLPLLLPNDVQRMIAVHGNKRGVTIAPDGDMRGTNAMACSPPDIIPFLYGRNSFQKHLAAAREAGVEPAIVRRHGLAFDVDDANDLFAIVAEPGNTRTQHYLANLPLDRRNGVSGHAAIGVNG